MYMIEITEDKLSCLSEDIEKGLRYLGKAMHCLDELKQSENKSGRERYGYRESEERYGMRGNMHESEGRYGRY